MKSRKREDGQANTIGRKKGFSVLRRGEKREKKGTYNQTEGEENLTPATPNRKSGFLTRLSSKKKKTGTWAGRGKPPFLMTTGTERVWR